MIAWLNGPFGVGKTATARAMVERRPVMRIFDPEAVGSMLAASLGDRRIADFQDLSAWRSLVPQVAAEMAAETGSDLIAVQSVLVEPYWAEIRGGLEHEGIRVVHILLDCSEEVLRERIARDLADPEAEGWRLDHVARYQAARSWLVSTADVVIDTSALRLAEVADRAIAALG
jgi:predicted kinase